MSMDTMHAYATGVIGRQGVIHSDVKTTDEGTALRLAREYLDRIGESQAPATLKECQFCHSEPLKLFSGDQQKQFREKGGLVAPLPA